jgi:site-specific DNA recombinase
MTAHFASTLQHPVVPKDGVTVRALLPCRVSDPKPGKQDERSLADQAAMHTQWLKNNLDDPYEVKILEGRESGEWIERADYLELIELVETGEYDLVLTEDLGRIIRRIHAHLFAELCVDFDTRLISHNDHVDTTQPGWQDRSIFSAWHHERSNRDTSDRIKRTASNRFDQGGCAAFDIAGYIKPPGAKSDLDWQKDPDWEAIYAEWFRMLDEDEATYSEIADWLNKHQRPTGTFTRKDEWDCRMVGRVTHNWLLKGYRVRNRRKSRRNSTGKYVSVKADPSELKLRHAPHLAFFDEDYYDRVIAAVDERNSKYRRKGKNGVDTRRRVPKKRTRFPGQSLVCGICGRGFVFGGHGQTDHLMCSGAREHLCWNGVTADGPLTAERISNAVFQELSALPEFDETLLSLVNEEALKADGQRSQQLEELTRKSDRLDREIENIMRFIRSGDSSDRVRLELRQLEESANEVKAAQLRLAATPSGVIAVPPIEEIKSLATEALDDLSHDSWEFCRVMQRMTPRIVVFPHRLCDGGRLVLRARFRFNVAGMIAAERLRDALHAPLERILEVDLFNPPQREEFRERVVQMRKTQTERNVAETLGITITAAQRASKLQKLMDPLSITDPYLPLESPPDDVSRLKRHRHHRYQFTALPDAGVV